LVRGRSHAGESGFARDPLDLADLADQAGGDQLADAP
jgi:hypothetical protein